MSDTASSPPSTLHTLSPDCAKTPCTLCYIRAKVKEAKETADAKFDKDPLKVNIVGFRMENSISDAFDDLMVIFFKALTPDQRENFERVVELDLRDSLKKLKHSHSRLVPCTDDEFRGLWVLAIYDQVTTDPGLSGNKSDYEKRKKDADNAVAENQKKLNDINDNIKNREKVLEEKNQRINELKANKDKTAEEVKELNKLIREEIPSLNKAQSKDKSSAQALEKKATILAKNAKKTHAEHAESVSLDQGEGGFLKQGRALMAPDFYPSAYRFGIHHIKDSKRLGHVAMTTGFFDRGLRVYSVAYIKQNKEANDAEVARYIPSGGVAKEFEDGKASIVVKPSSVDKESFDVFLVHDDKKTLLVDDDDVVVIRADKDKGIRGRIGGTNLHRGHNVRLANDKKSLYSLGGGVKVSTWSEGCQVYNNFDYFNEFIRINAVSKCWLCKGGTSTGITEPGCSVLKATPDGEETLGPGEQALLDNVGEDWVRGSLRTQNHKKLDIAKSDLKKITEKQQKAKAAKDKLIKDREAIEADRDNTWDDIQEQQLRNAKGPERKTLQEKKKHAWSAEKESKLQRKKAEIEAKEREINKADTDIKDKQKEIALYEGIESDLDNCAKEVDALKLENEELEKENKRLEKEMNNHKQEILKLERLKKNLERNPPKPPVKPNYPPSLSAEKQMKLDKKYENDLAKFNSDLEENKAKITEKEAEISSLNKKIDPLQIKYNDNKGKIDENNSKIENRKKLDQLKEETRKQRREFIRERTRFYAADFFRQCDFKVCKIKTNYTLLEVTKSVIDELKNDKLNDPRNQPWNGDPVLGS